MKKSLKTFPRLLFPVLTLALLLLVILVRNGGDWDAYTAQIELDRRAWIFDHAPPLWSYQYCGGLSRIGDPQSFGLSPVFLLILLFGSAWGSKIIFFLNCCLGYFFITKLLSLITRKKNGPTEIALSSLACLFLLGDWLLWRISVWHFTFSFSLVSIGIFYYTLKAWKEFLTTREIIFATLLTFTFYSGGVLHPLIYFVYPFFLSLFTIAISQLVLRIDFGLTFSKLKQMAGFHVLGLLLASYKLIGIASYQRQFPRTLSDNIEMGGLWRTLSFLTLPRGSSTHFSSIKELLKYNLWEDGAFSCLPWILIALVILQIAKRRERTKSDSTKAFDRFLIIYGIILVSFCLGDSTRFSLHYLSNHFLFSNSVRAIGRYHGGVTFLLLLIVASLMRNALLCDFYKRRLMLPAFFLAMVNAAFVFLKFDTWSVFWNDIRTVSSSEKMRFQRITDRNEIEFKNAYPLIKSGKGILNCYSPMNFPSRLDPAFLSSFDSYPADLPLVAPDGVPRSCVENSYFSQNKLFLDPSCPRERTCLNLNSLNPLELQSFRYNAKRHRFCLGP